MTVTSDATHHETTQVSPMTRLICHLCRELTHLRARQESERCSSLDRLGVELLRLSSRQSFYGINFVHSDVRFRPAVPAEYVDQFHPHTLEVGGTVGHPGHVDTPLSLADEEVDDAGCGHDGLLEVRAGDR